MSAYPWGWTTPNARDLQPARHRLLRRRACCSARPEPRRFLTPSPMTGRGWSGRDPADRPQARAGLPWAAGSRRGVPGGRPRARPRAMTPRSARAPGASCAAGAAAGHRPTTVWFAVAGSDKGVAAARAELTKALADPAGRSPRRSPRSSSGTPTPRWTSPVTRCWSAAWPGASRTSPTRCRRPATCSAPGERGQGVPTAPGHSAKARWLGAGWPDYPWLFATDGEYTAFASVATGQFATSRLTCGRCEMSAWSTATAARWCTR